MKAISHNDNTDKETARRKINERLGQIFAQYTIEREAASMFAA